jgi:hypothetical protein
VATQQIKSGDRIRVDGTQGVVEILETSPKEPVRQAEFVA